MIVRCNENILRLEVPVDYAFRVRGRERIRKLLGKTQDALERHLRALLNDLVQIAALDVGHGNELDVAYFAEVVNAQDVLVGDFACEEQFLFESSECVRVGHRPGANHLERDRAFEVLVEGLVHPTHRALPQQRDDAIARAEIGARGESGGVGNL
jgi:hypothetical protein